MDQVALDNIVNLQGSTQKVNKAFLLRFHLHLHCVFLAISRVFRAISIPNKSIIRSRISVSNGGFFVRWSRVPNPIKLINLND